MNLDVTTKEGLVALDLHLSEKSYIDSHVPTQADCDMFKLVTKNSIPDNLAHLGRWWRHIESFGAARNNFPPTLSLDTKFSVQSSNQQAANASKVSCA
jgi:elongation factor 1-beta